jgi:hypothetical protein
MPAGDHLIGTPAWFVTMMGDIHQNFSNQIIEMPSNG